MIHIQRFIERLQGAEARGQRDLILTVKEAKDLHADITRLLLALEQARTAAEIPEKDQVITINMDGGAF